MTRRKSTLVTLVCPICFRDFEVVRSNRGKRKYCSQSCSSEAKKVLYKDRYFHFHKLDEIKEKEICSLYVEKEMPASRIAPLFNVSNATITRVIRKHHVERSVSEASILRVKQHPEIVIQANQKKIGRFCGTKSARYTNGSSMWQKNIFERDGYKCQDCGLYEPEIVEAHHVVPKKIAPELEFDLTNGITLCPNCHKRRHVQITKNGTLRSKTKHEVDIWQLEHSQAQV